MVNKLCIRRDILNKPAHSVSAYPLILVLSSKQVEAGLVLITYSLGGQRCSPHGLVLLHDRRNEDSWKLSILKSRPLVAMLC